MSDYGDYEPDSDGWDDGFEAMKDSGDNSSDFLLRVGDDPEDDDRQWLELDDE